MARRKQLGRNTRSLFALAGGKSFAITLPIETLRAWNWKEHKELHLAFDDKQKRIAVEAKKP